MRTIAICAAVAALAILGRLRQAAAEPPEPAQARSAEEVAHQPSQLRAKMHKLLPHPKILPPLNRNLYLDDLNDVLHASQMLVNKRYPTLEERGGAANLLYRYHHPYCLPALLAVALDEDDDARLREECTMALMTYPAPLVVGPLIGLVDDPEIHVARMAQKALYQVTGRALTRQDLHLPPEADSPERERIQEEWRAWWKEHRQEFKAAGREAEEK